MSRLSELMRQVRTADPQLGKDLEAEISALTKRRNFGLVFEQHQPEAVELPGRRIRRGDKVRVLPLRGGTKTGDSRLWRVTRIERTEGQRVTHLFELDTENPETQIVPADDLVVVAEFRDRIYPGLVETGRVERGGDKPFHTVINAENFHALEMLTYTHRHSIDAIYVDPPYNTGARDWKYNNDYVASDDDYRHSKWLAFMERRLKISRELLKPDDSVLIVTIDEKECLRLGLLLEQIFPEAQIQMISSVINPKGSARSGRFSRVDEYLFFVYFGAAAVRPWHSDMLRTAESTSRKVRWAGLLRNGEGSLRSRIPSMFFPIFIDAISGEFREVGIPPSLETRVEDVTVPSGTVALWPIDGSGQELMWRLNPASVQEYVSAGWLRFGKRDPVSGLRSVSYLQQGMLDKIESGEIIAERTSHEGALTLTYADARGTRQPTTVWNQVSHSASEHGAPFVKEFLGGRRFPYPKSLYAVEDALRFIVKDKPGAVVLDFFSGSGTTAHAVMRLNRQDGGCRQSISVTNNEVSAEEQTRLRKQGLLPGDSEWEALGICNYITKPRITAAITGRTPQGEPIKGDYKFTDEFPMAEGFGENAAYFTLTYEAPLSVRHNRAFGRIASILWLRAGSRGRIIDELGASGWDVAEAYAVLENLDQIDAFIASLKQTVGVELAFIVTDDDSAFQMVCRELPGTVTAVRLYESYLQNFQINTGRSL